MRRIRAAAVAGAPGLALSAMLAVVAGCEPNVDGLPASIGNLALREEIRGEAAAAVINRMHGKGVTPRENRIGTYAGAGGAATLYLSTYGGEEEAHDVFERMDGGIAAGHPLFEHHRSLEISGMPVSFCLGQGQAHYYFRSDRAVLWLAVDMPISRATAEALVRDVESGRKR